MSTYIHVKFPDKTYKLVDSWNGRTAMKQYVKGVQTTSVEMDSFELSKLLETLKSNGWEIKQ